MQYFISSSEMLGMMKTLDIPVTEQVYASLITGYSRSGLVYVGSCIVSFSCGQYTSVYNLHV